MNHINKNNKSNEIKTNKSEEMKSGTTDKILEEQNEKEF